MRSGRPCILLAVDLSHGGRITLRRGAVSDGSVEYEGELVTAVSRFPSRVRVALPDGSVEIDAGDAPPWLVELARTTLRAAWRATRAGAEWPRRVSRWRAPKDDEGT